MGYQNIFTSESILQVSTQGEPVSNENACGGFFFVLLILSQ